MEAKQISLDSVISPNYEANLERYGDHSDTCIICGKRLKGDYKMVHYLTNGNLVSSDEEVENSQGFFPIGKDCTKKLDKTFIFS